VKEIAEQVLEEAGCWNRPDAGIDVETDVAIEDGW
jgi:hypothetical protein